VISVDVFTDQGYPLSKLLPRKIKEKKKKKKRKRKRKERKEKKGSKEITYYTWLYPMKTRRHRDLSWCHL